jgi:predicted RNase H-like nuclease (RuvC/YqgF family)
MANPYSPPTSPPPAKPTKQRGHDEEFLSISRSVSELMSRLRLLEERYSNLRREHQTTSHNMIENHQTISRLIRKFNDEVITIKREFQDVKEQITSMQGELVDVAKARDLKVVSRYIDFWEPVMFITRQEAQKMIDDALKTKDL